MKRTALVLLLLLGSTVVIAGGRWKVAIVSNATESCSEFYGTQLKEKFNSSSFFRLVDTKEASLILFHNGVDITNGTEVQEGDICTYSISVTIAQKQNFPAYLYTDVGFAGRKKVSQSVDNFFSELLEYLETNWAFLKTQ